MTTNYPDAATIREINVDNAYTKLLKNTLEFGTFVNYGNSVGSGSTLELRTTKLHVSGKNKYVTTRGLNFNLAFALAEVLWICSGRNDVEMLEFYNPNIKTYSDDGVTFNAPYGYRIFKRFGDQFKTQYEKLLNNSMTRQAVINIWDPESDNKENCKDYACNNLSQLLVREGRLHWTQLMRSNDLVWGLPYNFVQFISLQQIMASMLGLVVGEYTHFSNSSHIYFDFVDEARKISKKDHVFYNSPQLKCKDYNDFEQIVSTLCQVEETFRKIPETNINIDLLVQDPGWRNLIATIAVACKVKHGWIGEAKMYLGFMTFDSYERMWCERKIDKAEVAST